MTAGGPLEIDREERRAWLGVLATAPAPLLGELVEKMPALPPCKTLRPAETGLVMARGRAGGSGQRFNLGEVTVTRAAVESPAGHVGHGYVQGRDKRHAELAATLDALLQDESRRAPLMAGVIGPLEALKNERREALARKAAATRVDFFTLVRGES
jgi:alpha-D-ribose 1-methylphosphonate 5-triphosphate synthase subunit PhnG